MQIYGLFKKRKESIITKREKSEQITTKLNKVVNIWNRIILIRKQ
jgi:hypothetical protein